MLTNLEKTNSETIIFEKNSSCYSFISRFFKQVRQFLVLDDRKR